MGIATCFSRNNKREKHSLKSCTPRQLQQKVTRLTLLVVMSPEKVQRTNLVALKNIYDSDRKCT